MELEEGMLKCPYCGSVFCHINDIYITRGRDSCPGEGSGIRDTISVHCYDEQDPSHKWVLELKDYKGNIRVETYLLD